MTGKAWARVHLGGIVLMGALWALAALFKWVESVVFVSHVSMLALVLAEFAAFQGAKAEESSEKG